MITKDKITEIYCVVDDFCKEFEHKMSKIAWPDPDSKLHRRRKW